MFSKRQVMVGHLPFGGDAPVVIQSMTTTETSDVQATQEQIQALVDAGCQMVRIAVNSVQAAKAVRPLAESSPVPLAADVHFDYRLAIQSMENGIHKLRINPGNIGSMDRVRRVVDCAKAHHVPIRIGVNGGSLHPELYAKYGGTTAEALVESAMEHIHILEACGFYETLVAVKHSHVPTMVAAYRLLAQRIDYPLHLGVTEAGTVRLGTVKSAVGIGSLLLDGVGDTIRVSLSGDPVREVIACKDVLRSCGLYDTGVEVIACPTCGRCTIDVEGLALELERRVAQVKIPVKAAVMGCVVNGPGEAKDADIGFAGAAGDALVFFNDGRENQRMPADAALNQMVEEIFCMEKEAG